ncbi:hypothetical protein ABZW18_10210 [Streptomyces sp. NPDC004647]|uniref:hypothetical protein n=1 Tax=Streptomyces sp. NPDC004647 TaxID=3154671 RepID=UPI0033BE3839
MAAAYPLPSGLVLAQWAGADGLAELPLGRPFDLVRVSHGLGRRVVADLLAGGDATLGPVLWCGPRSRFEFLVPGGTAQNWLPLPGTRCVGKGSVLRCPMAHSVASPQVSGDNRTWVVPPDGSGQLTDPLVLWAHIEEQRSGARVTDDDRRVSTVQ